jgi:putative FmdB family regulatory protein
MPVYEYECAKCEQVTEAIRKMADADVAMPCEHCGSAKTSRKHSLFMAGAASQPQGYAPPRNDMSGGCGAGCACHP